MEYKGCHTSTPWAPRRPVRPRRWCGGRATRPPAGPRPPGLVPGLRARPGWRGAAGRQSALPGTLGPPRAAGGPGWASPAPMPSPCLHQEELLPRVGREGWARGPLGRGTHAQATRPGQWHPARGSLLALPGAGARPPLAPAPLRRGQRQACRVGLHLLQGVVSLSWPRTRRGWVRRPLGEPEPRCPSPPQAEVVPSAWPAPGHPRLVRSGPSHPPLRSLPGGLGHMGLWGRGRGWGRGWGWNWGWDWG
jgi:hypothetical protein